MAVNFMNSGNSSSVSTAASSSAVRALALEIKSLQEDPLEGIRSRLVNEDNLFEWEVALFGPPDTLYQGGYFKAHMKFPPDYPYSPPSVRFITKVWHPNVYENGDLCISILHPPVDDPHSGELPCERWNPTQNVRTILLSVVSLLNEPNTYSPANVDASVMFRRWKDSKGKDKEYENIIRKQVQASHADAEKDAVVVPTTMEEYCMKAKPLRAAQDSIEMDDFYDDDCYDMDDEDEESLSGEDDLSENEEKVNTDAEDSGNGESWSLPSKKPRQYDDQDFNGDIDQIDNINCGPGSTCHFDKDPEALKFLPIGGKIDIECDPKYDPDTWMKTTLTFTIIKKSRSTCDVIESGIIEVPPNFEGAYTGYPTGFATDVPCPSDPCKTG